MIARPAYSSHLPSAVHKHWRSSLVCLLLAAVSGCKRYDEVSNEEQVQLKAGRWENDYNMTQIDVPGLRQKHRDQITSEISKVATGPYCLEPAYVVSPPAAFFGGNGANDCKYESYNVDRGQAKIIVNCTMRGLGMVETQLDGKINAERFDFSSKVSVRLPMIGKVKFEGTSSGKFVGKCKGDE
jgi:Protein of unknown function (DUF3617)